MTPNGELTRTSGKGEEYIDTDDECFLNVLSLVLRDEQDEDI